MGTAIRLQCKKSVEQRSAAMPPPLIARARQSDLIGIRWLLDVEELPSADITEDALEYFLVYRDKTGVAGVVGLQKYGDCALLRSLVVTSEHMGRGLGRHLIIAAEKLAAELEVRSIYLLTTTAQTFFEHMGFHGIGREEAPPAIQTTREFTSLCPATAALMVKP
jgi:N-acetylglutamate synthase-like GNAT family acetyltransferase